MILLDRLLHRRKSRAIYLGRLEIGRLSLRSLLYLLAILLLHTALMVSFEGLSLGDAIWLTLTTATTVGYGDLSAQTLAGRVATVSLLFVGGIFILANFAGEYFEMRRGRRERMLKGNWEWNMEGHILIINTPAHGGSEYFQRLVGQLRQHEGYCETPILLLTREYPDGLPESLRDLGMVHHNGSIDSFASLQQVSPATARAIIVISKEEYEQSSDAITFDILHRLQESGVKKAAIIAECVADENRTRFLAAGADQVMRPSRAYPEILVRALVAPGSETILENLFVYEGDHTRRYDLPLNGQSWSEIACAMIRDRCGTPLAYVDSQGQTVCNPQPDTRVTGQGIILLVRSGAIPTEERMLAVLNAL